MSSQQPATKQRVGGLNPRIRTVRADDVYELSVVPPSSDGRGWRRLRQFLALAAMVGPIPEGGERLLIIEKASGDIVGEHRQRWADDFYDARIRADLRVLSEDDFRERWIDG